MSANEKLLCLLKFNGKDGPTYFVMKDEMDLRETDTDERIAELRKFFYEEHSCPTNWLSRCIMVAQDGDTDPHGFLEFVRFVRVPDDVQTNEDPHSYPKWNIYDDEVIAKLLPEVTEKWPQTVAKLSPDENDKS